MAPQKKLIILGGGESGTGAALLGQAKGFDVFLSDRNFLKDTYRDLLSAYHISFEEGLHSEERILNADLVIKSPGIPDKTELIQKLYRKGVPVLSEIEFAGRYTSAKTIAITGSNGKTTTTLLTWHLLRSAGLSVGLAGNIGESFARQVLEQEFDYYVLELSSFQLDNMYDFRADIAVLLNITPDHLDRYNYDFSQYAQSKLRVIRNQTSRDTFIYNHDDVTINSEMGNRQPEAKLLTVSLSQSSETGAFLSGDELRFRRSGQDDFSIPLKAIPLNGPHNYLNVMCSVLAALQAGVAPQQILAGLTTFKNAPHRLEKVATINGVDYINDSKATNVDSVYYALQSFDRPVILLLGGVDKGNDYDSIRDLVVKKVKVLIALGTDNRKLETYFKDLVPVFFATDSLEDAIGEARRWAVERDVVLLSPACASFDLFKNFEDRGDRFREAVLELT